jgi:type II secretory pathway component PulK
LRNLKEKKGIALLTVLVALMIITILFFEFQYASMVERKIAYNDLNQTQAYYLAKSGAKIGLLRLALYGRLLSDKNLAAMSKKIGDITPYLDKVWNIDFPEFPPEAGSLGALMKPDKDAAEKMLAQTKITDGKTSHIIKSESSKINLNSLIVPAANLNDRINFQAPPQRPDQYAAMLLLNLIEGFLRESNNPNEEFPNLRPEEQVMDIMDWVNVGDTRFFGGSKDSYYDQQTPPYKAKRNRFYTLDELRLVKGMDDHLFSKLSPHVTVNAYDGKINLNTASKEVYRALYKDFTDDDLKKIIQKRSELGSWQSEKQFIDFVSDTLGRSGFKTAYGTNGDYPFTVSTRSFSIEGIGRLYRSGSTIERRIKVGVALTRGQGNVSETNPNKCASDPDTYWNTNFNVCRSKPTNQAECVTEGGSWINRSGTEGCNITVNVGTGQSPMWVTPSKTVAGGPPPLPKALKILSWVES